MGESSSSSNDKRQDPCVGAKDPVALHQSEDFKGIGVGEFLVEAGLQRIAKRMRRSIAHPIAQTKAKRIAFCLLNAVAQLQLQIIEQILFSDSKTRVASLSNSEIEFVMSQTAHIVEVERIATITGASN